VREIRWGIVGPGRIAEKLVRDFAVVDGARALAVASRSADRAADFARRHGLERAYGSYAEIVADPDIDVLYLATPHPMHHALAVAGLEAGKALLVEKAFTATTRGAEEIVDLARSTGRFVMEAMWTRFQPAVVALRQLVADGAIGEVRGVQADLGVRRPFDPADRLFDLALGGGALLDVGGYVVSFRGDLPVGATQTATAAALLAAALVFSFARARYERRARTTSAPRTDAA